MNDMLDRNIRRLMDASRLDVDRSCRDFLRRVGGRPARSWAWLSVAAGLIACAAILWAIVRPRTAAPQETVAAPQDPTDLKTRIAKLEAALEATADEKERARIQASLDELRRKKPAPVESDKGPTRYDELTQEIERNPRDANLYVARAEESVWTKRWAEAEKDALKAIELAPKNGRAYCVLGRALFYLRRLKESKAAFARAVELDPSLADAAKIDPVEERTWQIRDELMDACGKLKMTKDPDERTTLEKKVQELEQELNRIEKGAPPPIDMKALEMRLKENPNDVAALIDHARALLDVGRTELALKDLDRAIELKPDHADGWLARSIAHAMLGDAGKSAEDFKRGCELAPKNTKAIESTGAILKKLANKRPAPDHQRQIATLVDRLEELRAMERDSNLSIDDRERARKEASRVETEIENLKKRGK